MADSPLQLGGDGEDDQPNGNEQRCTVLQEALSHLLDSVDELVLHIDSWGSIRYANGSIKRILDYAPEMVVGESIDTLLGDDENLDPDETVLSSDATIDYLLDEDADDVVVAFEGREGEVVPCRLSKTILGDENGEIDSFICVANPLDERQIHEARLQRRTEQTELLNQIVRHDIRNDANVITESVRRLGQMFDGDEETRQLLTQIEDGANRIVDLTERVRDLMQALEELNRDRKPVHLGDVLLEELAYGSTIGEGASVELEGDPPDVEVFANEMLSSVFRNLVSNAIEHHDGDDPSVTVSTSGGDETVTVRIADDGPGLPASVSEALSEDGVDLEQFGTTSFGLYIVQTLVERYGGDITAEANDPRGTVFHVTLERVDGSDATEE